MWRGLLLGASLCHAQGQDPFCEDEQAFLQIQQSKPHAQPLATDTSASLLSTVRNLALNTKQLEQSPETVTALVESIHSTIDEMKPQLITEHGAAQALLTDQLEEITACGDSSSYGTDATAFAALVQCRADVATATEEKNDACDLWLGEPSILRNQDDYPGCLPSIEQRTADEFLAHVEAWSTFVEAELSSLRSKKSHCETKTTTLEVEAARCAEEESEFDGAFCSRKTSCVLLHACHDHEVSGYESLVTNLRSAETARQAQFRSISQVECLLDLITTAVQGNNTIQEAQLDTCDGDAVDVDHLVLTVETPESLSACPEPAAGDPECSPIALPLLWTDGEATATPYVCPNGQDDCPPGFCYSLYDIYSTAFLDGYDSMESCRDKCASTDGCVGFEWSASRNNCGVNNRGWSGGASNLVEAGEDPGASGDMPWYGGGVLQSAGQPSHKTCYPAPEAAPAPPPPSSCPDGRHNCPSGFCYSAYDIYSTHFLDGFHSMEECRDRCQEWGGCVGFEWSASRNNCGVNNRGLSEGARNLIAAGEDPGANGDMPWYGGGVLQSAGQPSHETCYPEPAPVGRFYYNLQGSTHLIGWFEDYNLLGAPTLQGQYSIERVDCTSRLIRAHVQGGNCGDATVQFRINDNTNNFFKSGAQSSLQSITEVTVISGNVPHLPAAIWTGVGSNKGWILYEGISQFETMFAASYQGPEANRCNGQPLIGGETVELFCVQA